LLGVLAGVPALAQTETIAPVPQSAAVVDADRRCMRCHGQEHIGQLSPADRLSMVSTLLEPGEVANVVPIEPLKGDEPATRPNLFMAADALGKSPHSTLRCIECHTDAAALPHRPTLNRATCATECHQKASEGYFASIHRSAFEKKDPMAPTCASCHGGHDIHRVTDRKAPQHRLNALFLCGDCHTKHSPSQGNGDSVSRVSNYLESAHAKGVTKAGLIWSATCADCHGAHAVLPSKDPASSVNRANVPETCGKCHAGVAETYATSVHGLKHAENNAKAAVCTDCHTAHQITQASTPEFLGDVVAECGQCHNTPGTNGDRVGTYYETYHKSYHGQVTNLGGTRAARCSDCHGAHDILPLSDPASSVSPANVVGTCARCHPSATTSFARFDPHANYRDAKHFPILHGVWLYFMIMMSTVFTFFGLHTILWFARSMVERAKHGKPHHPQRAATAIRRFTAVDRINHIFVALTFFGLTATGIPLVFSDQHWAAVAAKLLGGIEAAGLWHRFFAILLIANFALHFTVMIRNFLRRQCSWKEWIFGPNSLVPRWKDALDIIGMFRWFVGMGRRPAFDRWTYWEKFDYWAEVGGSMIIGGSGLLLWFPEIAARIVPGWMFNVAMIVHGYEALLAIGFIFTIHFFNAHGRPGTFPVDEVIFTGSMPEHELQEQRPEEYARLVKSGKLDSLRVPAPDPKRRRVWIVIAALTVGFGLLLLGLILAGGLS
jgi:cytochrome b subunit of formate dehydrogenase